MSEHVCNFRSAWPVGHPLPLEDPAKLQGPEVGTFMVYRVDTEDEKIVRVIERSCVWSPGECRHKGGYRNYTWSVVEAGPTGYWRVVVNDSDLSPYTGRVAFAPVPR